jgi:hypothetical protein
MRESRHEPANLRGRLASPLAILLIAVAQVALAAPTAMAQTDNAPSTLAAPPVIFRDADGRVVVHATRVTTPIRADGRLDEEAYATVPAITEFIQGEPDNGAPITERTEAWVMFDDNFIYISCRCWDPQMDRIVANDMRRDSPNLRNNDNFAVEFDTFHDRRNGFLFYVTPIGALFDGMTTDERQNNSDWNTVWEGKVGRFEGGWTAEMAIPFKSLRYKPERDQTWGINLRRVIRSKNEWAYIVPTEMSWGQIAIFRVSAAATLTGVQAPAAAKNLEIKPYAISRLTTDLLARPPVDNDFDPDAGVDVKYGVTKSLTADLTYNTDFAQVEEDEAQVNLTRFNLFFPEKREFFLEGAGTFSFGTGGTFSGGAPPPPGVSGQGSGDAPTIFFSRRIGIHNNRPIPIIGGGRLTGKAGAWNIGVLDIVSDDDLAVGAEQTNFAVFRVRRDVLRRSSIGGIFTGRNRSVVAPGANQVAGADASFAFYDNVYLSGYAAKSRTEGLEGEDWSYRTQFTYSADRYGLTLDRTTVDDNFNPEVGFMRRQDFRKSFASARFSPRPRRSRVRKYYVDGAFDYITNNDNVLETRVASGAYRMEFQNSDLLSFSYSDSYEFLQVPFQIADGVRIPRGVYEFGSFLATYNPGQQHRLSGSGSFEAGSFYDGDKITAAFRGRLAIVPQLAVEPNISLNWIDLPQASFTNTVLGARTLYSMTPRMYVSALVQYASSTTSVSANIRFRWEYQPGSELFVVYTEGRDTFPEGSTALETRGFVVKINRLFRF